MSRNVALDCPSPVRVGDEFVIRRAAVNFELNQFTVEWAVEGDGTVRGLGAVESLTELRALALTPGTISVDYSATLENDEGGCGSVSELDLTGSCTFEVLPAEGDDDDDDSGDDDSGDDDSGDDDDDSGPPEGWSEEGSFGDGQFPADPSVVRLDGVTYAAAVEPSESPGEARDDHDVAPLRVGPDFDLVAEATALDEDEDAWAPKLVPDRQGGLLLLRTYITGGDGRMAVDRFTPGAASLVAVETAVAPPATLPPLSVLTADAGGVPLVAWVEGGQGRLAYTRRLGAPAEAAQFLASPVQLMVPLPTDPVRIVALVGSFQTTTDVAVYEPDGNGAWTYGGALSSSEIGWNESEITATVTPEGDVVVAYVEIPAPASGLLPRVVARRWTPGTAFTTTEDLQLDAPLANTLSIVAGPGGELWFAGFAIDGSGFLLLRRDPLAAPATWVAVPTAPAPPSGEVDGFSLSTDGATPGLVHVAQSWRGPGGNGLRVLRYQAPNGR